MMRIPLLLALVSSFFFLACSEEEQPLSPYCQELAEVQTDAAGGVVALVTDKGDALPVTNPSVVGTLVRDTVYRVLCLYVANPDGVEIHGLSSVVSPMPASFSGQTVPTDPLKVEALWRGGRYVNFLVTVATGNKSHKFAFVDRGVTEAPGGSHKLQVVELYHDQNGDASYYERQVYLSCPVYGFKDFLVPGRDSIEVRVNTFGGNLVKRLPF